jgi:hypothetical protein
MQAGAQRVARLERRRKTQAQAQTSTTYTYHHRRFRQTVTLNPRRPMLCPLPSPQVNIIDYDGRTPLGIAASEAHVESVQYLLAHGANASIKDIRCASAQARVNSWYWPLHRVLRCAILGDARREKRESVVEKERV